MRALDRRLGYMRKDGLWKKADTISITKTVYVVVNLLPEGDHEYAAIEYAQRPDLMPMKLKGPILDGDKKHDFKTQQPDLPLLDKPAVAKASALTTRLSVWAILAPFPTQAKVSPSTAMRVKDAPVVELNPVPAAAAAPVVRARIV